MRLMFRGIWLVVMRKGVRICEFEFRGVGILGVRD